MPTAFLKEAAAERENPRPGPFPFLKYITPRHNKYAYMTQTLKFSPTLRATIVLPSSKSESNRALLLCALSGTCSSVEHLSSCDDTYVMWRALTERREVIDVQAAGTAMRFLTAYFAVCNGEEHLLTGTARMLERPIGVLVDALRALGADIAYEEREGYPPVRVRGRKLAGGLITLPANVSSQYVSALLMTAPMMEKGLTLELDGEIVSRPYIEMTLSLMRRFGVSAGWEGENVLHVPKQSYADGVICPVESDWSAASYWYEMVALTSDAGATVRLPWLYETSLQGDSMVRHFFEGLGVRTVFNGEDRGVTLSKTPLQKGEQAEQGEFSLDLSDQPDLAQTLVVTCAMLRRKFRFTGVRSLRIKETDRIEALRVGLSHFGINLGIEGDDSLYIKEYPSGTPCYDGQPIPTFNDHRMAMSFAPAALVCDSVCIADPSVVSKSYPLFWEDLRKVGVTYK